MSYKHRKKTILDFSLFFQKISVVQIVVASGTIIALMAFLFWTLPSWGIVGPNLPQIPGLWQNPTNRLILFILTIKLISPALVGLLLTAGGYLLVWIKPRDLSIQQYGIAPTQRTSTAQREPLRVVKVRIPVAPVAPMREHMADVASTQQSSQTQPDPITPLPPTHDNFLPLSSDPVTPLPPMHDNVQPLVQEHTSVADEQQDVASSVPLETLEAPTFLPERASSQETVAEEDSQESLPVTPSTQGEQRPYTVEIWLLKRPRLAIKTAQGISYEVPLTINAKRVHLLAYIAWRRGEIVDRVTMLEDVFGHGRNDENSTMDKLGEAFDSHKKLLRKDLRDIIRQVNTQAEHEIIPSMLDIFLHSGSSDNQYWLSDVCRVVDLEEIERQHQIIEQARTDKRIDEQSVFACVLAEDARKKNTLPPIPDDVKNACDRLIHTYGGDFIGDVIQNYLHDFDPWTSSWVREPYTLFRDYYFQALWYAAEYELRQSLLYPSENDAQKHWEQAAVYYRKYALRSCDSRFDMKVTFGGGHGERVRMSERALRRLLVLYGTIGATHLVDQVYTSYRKQMYRIAGQAWKPSQDTRADYLAAKKQTGEYRFPDIADASLLDASSLEGNGEEDALETTD